MMATPSSNEENKAMADLLTVWTREHMSQMRRDVNALNVAKDQLNGYLGMLEGLSAEVEAVLEETNEAKKVCLLNNFRKKLIEMRLNVPYLKFKSLRVIHEFEGGISTEGPESLHASDAFRTSMEFREFEALYQELEERVRLCLLCFSIFPRGAAVQKRLMLQWWLVEGFASTKEDAQCCLDTLIEKGFVELDVKGSCRVHHPLYRPGVVALAERARVFSFGRKGYPEQSFLVTLQACLMGADLIPYDDIKKKKDQQELEKLHLLINVGENLLELKEEWIAGMKNLNFLHLGDWKEAANHHIEVADPKFLAGLGDAKFLKFLSLQGVSRVFYLPDSILRLSSLEILDLRACSQLETIPERVDFLQRLTHLDMSECYMLTRLPKALSRLTNLKVLKGFFLVEHTRSCTLRDLGKLKLLEKLCIYTDREDFPQDENLMALERLVALTKLTIYWRCTKWRHERQWSWMWAWEKPKRPGMLPQNLEKLDLKCFPMAYIPDWLKPENMEHIKLKKLYIRGGKLRDLGQFCDLGQYQRDIKWWSVEELRLKYLGEMEMEWRELRGLFPKLKYVEKVKCPKLTLFPCDAKGVWRSTP